MTDPKGLQVKLKNRRVCLWRFEDGSYQMRFKRLGNDQDEQKVVTTQLKLSEEAMRSLASIYRKITPQPMSLSVWHWAFNDDHYALAVKEGSDD